MILKTVRWREVDVLVTSLLLSKFLDTLNQIKEDLFLEIVKNFTRQRVVWITISLVSVFGLRAKHRANLVYSRKGERACRTFSSPWAAQVGFPYKLAPECRPRSGVSAFKKGPTTM